MNVLHPSLHSLRTVFSSFDPELYMPATFVSYQFDEMVAGLNPLFFHLHNLLLHLGSGILLFFLLKKLKVPMFATFAVVTVFLLHPVQTEAVAWLAARKDLQSSFFLLASFLTYLTWLDAPHAAKKKWYALTVIFFLVALLSKVSVAIAPLLFFLVDRWKHSHLDRSAWIKRSPFWLLSGIFIVVAFFGKSEGAGHLFFFFTQTIVACESLLFAFVVMLVPAHLSPLYVLTGWETVSLFGWCSAFVVLALLGSVIYLLRRKHVLGFLLSAVIILFLPSIFTFWKDGVVYLLSDRYLYLALVPFTLAVFIVLAPLFSWLSHAKKTVAHAIILFCIVATYSVLTFLQAERWQSDTTLFSYVLSLGTESHIAEVNMGNALRAAQDFTDAGTHYSRAFGIKPDYATAYRNLGAIYLLFGAPEPSLVYYNTALAFSPQGAEGHEGLGFAYSQMKKFPRAEMELKSAISLDPTLMDAYLELGNVYYQQKDSVHERQVYEDALRINPWYQPARQNLEAMESKE